MIVIDKVDGSRIDDVSVHRTFTASAGTEPVPLLSFDGTDAHGVDFLVTLDLATARELGTILLQMGNRKGKAPIKPGGSVRAEIVEHRPGCPSPNGGKCICKPTTRR
jgi:hypothetical protein